MKKLFFFRSSTDKQVCAEHSSKSRLSGQGKKNDGYRSESLKSSHSETQKHASENQSSDNHFGLRRSHSFSSAAFLGNATAYRSPPCYSDQSSSPSSSGSIKTQHHQPSRSCTLTPERHVKTKRVQEGSLDHGVHKPVHSRSFRGYNDSWGDSSLSSSNVSNEVLDLYIDGEQQNERSRRVKRSSWKDHIANGGDKKPPRSHCTAPASPTGGIKGRSRSHSSRSRDWVETGFAQESPRDLAKHVAEKLCRAHISPGTNSKDYDSDVPITIEDIYKGSLNSSATLKSNSTHYLGFEGNNNASFSADSDDELDVELKSKFKEAQERIFLLSEELEQESFLRDIEFNVPAFVQRIKHLTEEKVSLAVDLSSGLQSQLANRAFLKEQVRSMRLELDSRTQRLEKEKNEMMSALEKELDRRSSDWSMKLEKYQVEEQRLRERVRELAEQNVSLQREVSYFREIEMERRNMISFSEKQIKDLTFMLEASQRENQELRQSYCELQDKFKVAQESRDSIQSSYGEKEEESKDLHMCVTRLIRTCSEQEKTIDGLRGELAESVQKNGSVENFDKHVQKLQMEQIRLTGVEQALRREVDSYKLDVDSLRHENINLLNRLQGCGKAGGSLTFKLDQEMWARLHCLQKQGLSLLNDSTNLCSKLLDSMKRVGRSLVKKDGVEVNRLDAQFVIESDVKVQGFKRGIESLMRSLQNIATILEEKSQVQCSDSNGFGLQNEWNLQEQTRAELKGEKLLTSLLREKLYAKDREVEQLEAEVATATRGNDILRCELQNALDSLSCVTHKMKELELQMIKKEEKINQLETELEESTKELTIVNGILPKVTEERDMMWQEVKQYTEQNMLLNSEVNILKRKIEALDEDVLLKEGQITILKDSLGRKSFDLLASPDRTHEFLLE